MLQDRPARCEAAAAIRADLAASERCQACVIGAIVALIDTAYSAIAVSGRIRRLSFLREHAVSLVPLPALPGGACGELACRSKWSLHCDSGRLVYCLEEINIMSRHAHPDATLKLATGSSGTFLRQSGTLLRYAAGRIALVCRSESGYLDRSESAGRARHQARGHCQSGLRGVPLRRKVSRKRQSRLLQSGFSRIVAIVR